MVVMLGLLNFRKYLQERVSKRFEAFRNICCDQTNRGYFPLSDKRYIETAEKRQLCDTLIVENLIPYKNFLLLFLIAIKLPKHFEYSLYIRDFTNLLIIKLIFYSIKVLRQAKGFLGPFMQSSPSLDP